MRGRKMAGHMGVQKVTLKNRPVITIAAEQNIIAIKGPIPGSNKGYVYINFD
jgi:large subunit ribosomal protein L3